MPTLRGRGHNKLAAGIRSYRIKPTNKMSKIKHQAHTSMSYDVQLLQSGYSKTEQQGINPPSLDYKSNIIITV